MANSILRMIRFLRDITLDELSLKADVDPATLSRLERGLLRDTAGTKKIKERVATALEMNLSEIFPGAEKK